MELRAKEGIRDNDPILAFLLPEIAHDQDTETHRELVGESAHSSADSKLASGGDFTTTRDDTLLTISCSESRISGTN